METPPPPERPDAAPSPSPSAPPPPPAGPQAPAPSPEAPVYGGPVPPGGGQQPIEQGGLAWHGRPLASWGSRAAAYLIGFLLLILPVGPLILLILPVAAA